MTGRGFLQRVVAVVAGIIATGFLLHFAGRGFMGGFVQSLAARVTDGYGDNQ